MFQLWEEGRMAKDCWSKKKRPAESNAITSSSKEKNKDD